MALTPTRRGVRMPDARPAGQGARLGSWAFLVLLLTANLVAVFVLDPRLGLRGGRLPPDAATHALQAASVAHDLDLQYSKADLDRFVSAHGERPGGVFLRSPDRGERIAYGVPVPYAVLAAPVVRFAPGERALWLANALFLALACVAATFTLERRIGPTAPLWTAAYAFASVAFAYTFRAGPELFAAALVACAFALAYRGEGPLAARYTEIYDGLLPGERLAGRALARWMGVGLLAGTAATFHPFYLLLLWPLALAVPEGRRRTGASVLVASALVAVVAWGGLQAAAGGGWVPWDRGGRLFTPETGFPAVDVPVAAWPAEEGADGLDLDTLLPGGLPDDPPGAAVLGWNALFLALGRHLGVLPYFLPLLLGFAAFLGERGRWAIAPAVLLALAGTLLASPYAFSSIGGSAADAPGNAFFLPLYPALWFLAARPLRAAWPVVAALVGGLYLYPAWLDPTAAGAGRTGASVVAQRVLPFESTQTGLPGVRDAQLGALWVRFDEGGVELGSGDTLWLEPGQEGSLWLGSPVPVATLALELMPGGPSRADVAGAEIARTVLSPDGGVSFVLDPGEPDRRHTVAWSSTPYAFYRLTVAFPEAAGERIGFNIEPQFRAATEPSEEP